MTSIKRSFDGLLLNQSDITLIAKRSAVARRAAGTTSAGILKQNAVDHPRFRKPFETGYKRYIVYREKFSENKNLQEQAIVFYKAPNKNKIFRTKKQIADYFKNNHQNSINIGNFTFARAAIGMPPEQEVIRHADGDKKTKAKNARTPAKN